MQIIVYDSGVTQPKDKEILLKDIIEDATTEKEKAYCIDANYFKGSSVENYIDKSRRQMVKCGAIRGRQSGLDTVQMLEIRKDKKTNTLTSVQKDNVIVLGNNLYQPHNNKFKQTATIHYNTPKSKTLLAYSGDKTRGIGIHDDSLSWRKLTPIECERLQTLPVGYTNHVSNSQRYKMLGNGWTVDVIAHIFKGIK